MNDGSLPGGADSTRFALVPDVIRARRSIRRYLPAKVDEEIVQTLLAAAADAPSSHNRQPWRFVVLRPDEHKAQLANAMGERLRADRTRDGDRADVIEADVARSFARITGAPIVIAVCLTLRDVDQYPDAKRNQAEFLMAVQSTAMAVQNLLLAAHDAGLGACWMCAPLFCPDAVSTALALPADWQPQALVTVGYPADGGKPYQRRPLADLVKTAEAER